MKRAKKKYQFGGNVEVTHGAPVMPEMPFTPVAKPAPVESRKAIPVLPTPISRDSRQRRAAEAAKAARINELKRGRRVMPKMSGGGMTPPKPDMRSYEEQQKDIDAQREKRAKEKAAAREREAKDAEMDRKMREGREKARKTPLFRKGGKIDGCAMRGKTRGRMC